MIRKMDEAFQNAAFKNDPGKRYDTRITLAQFDMILQATLLSMALSDGNFDRLEQQFVDKITDYGDLLTYIKQDSQGRLDLTWSQVASLREETPGLPGAGPAPPFWTSCATALSNPWPWWIKWWTTWTFCSSWSAISPRSASA